MLLLRMLLLMCSRLSRWLEFTNLRLKDASTEALIQIAIDGFTFTKDDILLAFSNCAYLIVTGFDDSFVIATFQDFSSSLGIMIWLLVRYQLIDRQNCRFVWNGDSLVVSRSDRLLQVQAL